MRKTRIGNDIQVSWEVKTNGEAVSLEGRQLRLYVRSAYAKQEITDFSVKDNVIRFNYPASMQRSTGARAVELVDTTAGQTRTICADQAFTLVAHSSEEGDGCCSGCDFDEYMVSLKSNVLVGRPGMSAYDIWLSQGNTGTESDFLDSLKGEKGDSGTAGRVLANEISGHRQVADLEALHKLLDWQLSASGNNTGNDAVGQLWYVVDTDGKGNGNLYQLINWDKRNTAGGWRVFTANSAVDLSDYLTAVQADTKYAAKDLLSGYATTEALSETEKALNSRINDECVKNGEIDAVSDEDINKIWNSTRQV